MRLRTPNAGALNLIPGWVTRSHIPKTKTWHGQIKKNKISKPRKGFPGDLAVKNLPAMQETWF